MSSEVLLDSEPPTIDPYEALGLERDATADQVKSAYRKAALKHHPDKVPTEKREEAHKTFQGIAFAYAILSDPTRRKRYDSTGSTSESIVDSEGFDWSEYYRAQFAEAVNGDAIAAFAAKYKGSDEEREDVLAAYEEAEGDMDFLYENVMLSNVLDDDERFRQIIDEGIANGDVSSFAKYRKEPKKKREARTRAARAEAEEAEEMAKELGVHDKLFGGKDKAKSGENSNSKGKKGKGNSEDALKALIQQRSQNSLDSLIGSLEAKYGGGSKSKKGKKRSAEPTEEEFQAAATKVKKQSSEQTSTGRSSKRAKR